MKLICIESVQMQGPKEKDQYQAFTEGKEYRARRGTCQGLDGDGYEYVPVLRAPNDKKESHIIRRLKDDRMDEFFFKHFKEI